MAALRKRLNADERDLFEYFATKLHGWGERDYEKNFVGEYTFMEQRRAFAIWMAARTLIRPPKQELDNEEFWLLVRRFSTAPDGEKRAHAKQAVLLHVAKLLDKATP